jgi:hypothetical protein
MNPVVEQRKLTYFNVMLQMRKSVKVPLNPVLLE